MNRAPELHLDHLFVHACQCGDVNEVKRCLAQGADINYQSAKGLVEACQLGHMELSIYLITHPRLARQYLLDTLFEASQSPSLELVKWLCEHPQLQVLWGDLNDELMTAVLHKRSQIVDYFLFEHDVTLTPYNMGVLRAHYSHSGTELENLRKKVAARDLKKHLQHQLSPKENVQGRSHEISSTIKI